MSSGSVRLKNLKTYFLKLKSDIKLHVELTSRFLLATSVYLQKGKIVLKKTGEWSTKEQQRRNVSQISCSSYHYCGQQEAACNPNFRVAKCIMHDWHYVANGCLEYSTQNEKSKKTTCLITCV